MRHPAKAPALELKYGKSLRDILIEVLERTSSNSEAARELDVSPSHLCHWLQRQGLKANVKRTVVAR